MRILYGAFAQGQGHFSKAAVLVPLLEARGHDVRVISSGGNDPPSGYRFRWHRHFPGLAYVVTDGRIDYGRTFRQWVRELPPVFKHLVQIRGLVREFELELIISDFEPLSASPCVQPKCEVVALSRQVAPFDRAIPLPGEMSWERKMTRTVIRLFTCGADRLYGYHYEPASFRCVPPVIRSELSETVPRDGDHVLVYNHYHTVADGSPAALLQWAERRRVSVRAYGFPAVPRGRQGSVTFRPSSRTGMLDDMASARAVITSAGLTTAVEAFLLGKPACTVPIPGQWEQLVNAFHLDEAGIARRSDTWNYDLLLDLPAPDPRHPLMNWLRITPDHILDHVLDGRSTIAPPQTVHPATRTAA